MNQKVEICQNCKKEFTIEPEDFDFYKKIQISPPTFCPDCRMQRRLVARNERTFYKDTCDLCNKSIVSMYSPDKPFTVYCRECWYSDTWDPLQYGVDYDFQKPFFVQFRELIERVPRLALVHYRSTINSEYANFTVDVKNAYLSYSILYSEDVYYSRLVDRSKDCFDCLNIKNSEMTYAVIDGSHDYNSAFLLRSRNCVDSLFLFDCANCQKCFMSSNLRNKRYVFRNKQLSKEEYKKEIKNINTGSFARLQELKKEFGELMRNSIHKFANIVKSVNCIGDNIETSKNALNSFNVYNCEDIKFVSRAFDSRSVYDTYGSVSELSYEVVASGLGSYNMKFIQFGDSLKDSLYANWCRNCSHVFGCTVLSNKSYCILNKQYSKDEYEILIPKIIKHMNDMPYVDVRGCEYRFGEFFPIELGEFAYNETLAQEYFPLTKEEATAQGYNWRDQDPYSHKPTIHSSQLLDSVQETTDSVLREIIACNTCERAYRIIKHELDFLKKNNIALPRTCPECRHQELFALSNPLKLWHRKCMCLSAEALAKADAYQNTTAHFHGEDRCPNEFETSYAPERREVVYCEACYNAEVI